MERIYCISGLGADHRLFANLVIPGYELVPLPWVHVDKGDTMVSYARKMFACITDKDPIIIGLSFGGMLAVEIAQANPGAKVFIVSSAKGPSELALHGGTISKWLTQSGIIPAGWFSIPNPVVLGYLGAKTPQEKKLLSDVVRDSDGHFMKWALQALTSWQNKVAPRNVVHIHGTADKTIPSALVHPDYWVEGGTHIMIYNRAAEISEIIARMINHI